MANLPRDRTSTQVGLEHEPLQRSVPFSSDNRAGIIADLAGSDSIERVFKTQLFIPRCKMAFSMGKGRNEQGTIQQSTFIDNTYVQPTIMQYTGEKQKQYNRLQARINLHALTQFYLRTRRHQHSLKRKERATLTDESCRQGP